MNIIFNKLHLDVRDFYNWRPADVLQISQHSMNFHDCCSEDKLIQTFMQKLLMMNYKARYIDVIKTNQQDDQFEQITTDSEDDDEDDNDFFYEFSAKKSHSERIDPMDVQMALFHRSDGLLKQMMVTKLSQCQFALPLLVPDLDTQQIEFPLWTFRQINKSWKIRNTNNEITSQTQPISKAQTPMVFFFRFGPVSSSKSQLMNSLINEKHNTFFHRNCPGSSRTRVLMDGVVEIAWFCPSGGNEDQFNDCVAFCNLHGDAGDHEKQLQILMEMASVNVVLLPRLDKNDTHAAKIQNLYRNRKPLVCLFTEDESSLIEIRKGKFKIGLKDRNQSDVHKELREAINDCLSKSASTFRLEDISKHSDIKVDEENDDVCRRGKEAALEMMSSLENKDLTEIKGSFLPHQGKLWHQWSQKNKELHRPRGEDIEMTISRKQTEMKNIREQQHETVISEFMKHFIKEIDSHDENYMILFLKWLRILLDGYTSADLSKLHHKYDEKWSTVLKCKKNQDKNPHEQIELERISEEIQAATFGVEHIMREIGQIYESCESVKENKKELPVPFSSLPSLAAQMMISGFPLELMDGDAAHVPVVWISAVLDQLVQKLGDQRVFVLSVLGIQSSGKSTMLNAMFGLQFAVSAGRCTRGAFMQLIKVSEEMKTQINIDYILVVDTEGLRAPELEGISTIHHDNELATFVVGIAHLTLINNFGENSYEMQDVLQIVVQAFMRMKIVRLNPSCVFVHQNVSDVTAIEKSLEGRRRLLEKLDEMTTLAAKEEVYAADCFNDVIRFDVQKDVKYFVNFWEGNPPMAPPNPKYCENVQQLNEIILSYASTTKGIMLKDLKDRVKDIWEALLNEHFVLSFRNSLEISVYRKLETEYRKWTWNLRSAMMETENKLYIGIENGAISKVTKNDLENKLKETSIKVKQSMSDFFENDTYAEILNQWKNQFENKISELEKTIVRETNTKLNIILRQQDWKKKTDERKNHENTIYEKCKGHALKVKGKTKNTNAIKEEFDLIWEQVVKMIVGDNPPIRDIDIMRDVKVLLCDIYGSAYVDHWKLTESSNSECNIFGMFSKSEINELIKYDDTLSPEDEDQITSFVTDVLQETDKMIPPFRISDLGYNKACLQKLTDYTRKRVTEYQHKCEKYKFKNEFFIDLVYSVCRRANEKITDQYRLFREAKDPMMYVEKKREDYYSIFQKYCNGAPSAVIFGEILCQKLKEPIVQSVYKKTSRDLTDEIMENCESLNKNSLKLGTSRDLGDEMRSNSETLNENRSNLEKRILKTLAEEEDFDKYMEYIKNPKDHFKSFIRNEVSHYITDKFDDSVFPKMEENIELLQQKIQTAAHESTEDVQDNSGDVHLWLKCFTHKISDELIFSERDFDGIMHEDVDDFSLLEDVITQELSGIISDISSRFTTETFPVKLDHKFRPDELLINHLCQCCWVKCPFCAAICTNTIENHDGDHSVHFHRYIGLNGWFYRGTTNLSVSICTLNVASDRSFHPDASDKSVPWREYRSAGGVYADWSITPDVSELPYWKWFVCRFQKDLEKYYKHTFEGYGKIPEEWRSYSKQKAIESLDQCK